MALSICNPIAWDVEGGACDFEARPGFLSKVGGGEGGHELPGTPKAGKQPLGASEASKRPHLRWMSDPARTLRGEWLLGVVTTVASRDYHMKFLWKRAPVSHQLVSTAILCARYPTTAATTGTPALAYTWRRDHWRLWSACT